MRLFCLGFDAVLSWQMWNTSEYLRLRGFLRLRLGRDSSLEKDTQLDFQVKTDFTEYDDATTKYALEIGRLQEDLDDGLRRVDDFNARERLQCLISQGWVGGWVASHFNQEQMYYWYSNYY